MNTAWRPCKPEHGPVGLRSPRVVHLDGIDVHDGRRLTGDMLLDDELVLERSSEPVERHANGVPRSPDPIEGAEGLPVPVKLDAMCLFGVLGGAVHDQSKLHGL